MTAQTLTLTYTGPSPLQDAYWIRIEQESVDETATIADAASLIDALYDIDPCNNSESGAEESTSLSLTSASPSSTMAEAIEETLDLSYCDAEADGSVEVEIIVIRSHLDDPYTLRLNGGSVVETVQVNSSVTVTEEITEELTLPYPVVAGFTCTPAPLKRNGNTLRFTSSQVGRMLVATYQTKWDLVTVKVDGIDGEPGDCTALAFHHGVVAEYQLDVPNADEADTAICPSISWKPVSERNQVTCYKDIIVSQRCTCSETEMGSYTYQQTVPCPDREIKCPGVATECMHFLGTELVVERVDCADDNQIGGGSLNIYKVSDPDYYRKMCCQEPSGALPQCPTRRMTYKGDQPIEFGEAYWRDLYGKNARFVPVPPPGGICGEWIIRQKIASNNCCDGVEPLAWDTSISPDVMAPNSSVVIGVLGGGKYPYQWEVFGHGFQFSNGSRAIETDDPTARLSALVGACGTATVTVTDGCSTVTSQIRSTSGQWTETCYVGVVTYGETFHPAWRYGVDVCADLCSINYDGVIHDGDGPDGAVGASYQVYLWESGKWWPVYGTFCSFSSPSIDRAELMAALTTISEHIKVVYGGSGANAPPTDGPSPSTSIVGMEACAWIC